MATANEAGLTRFTKPTDREVVITRTFDAPRRLVYEAHTRCEHVRQWMTGPAGWTMPICEMDLRPGGAIRWVWRRADGSEMEIRCVCREVLEPERIVMTESWGAEWPDTLNTTVFTEDRGRTAMTLTMLYPSREARDGAMETGAEEGSAQSYANLDAYLRTIA